MVMLSQVITMSNRGGSSACKLIASLWTYARCRLVVNLLGKVAHSALQHIQGLILNMRESMMDISLSPLGLIWYKSIQGEKRDTYAAARGSSIPDILLR
jgi:hypothetical protein